MVLVRIIDLALCRSCACVPAGNRQGEFWFLLRLLLDSLASSVRGGARDSEWGGLPPISKDVQMLGSQKELYYIVHLNIHRHASSCALKFK